MVDYFVGIIKEVHEQEIVLDIGTMGIALQVANEHTFEMHNAIKIYSYIHWHAENGPNLFGFGTIIERSIFKIIISCSGIGPKIALAILADLGAENFLQAITTGDDQALSKVSGIGKKKAEQIVVQLKHKVARLLESGSIDTSRWNGASHYNDVSLALQSLNYSRIEIGRAMEHVKKNISSDTITFDLLLRQALSYLAK